MSSEILVIIDRGSSSTTVVESAVRDPKNTYSTYTTYKTILAYTKMYLISCTKNRVIKPNNAAKSKIPPYNREFESESPFK